jgi:hypothetical protein
VLDIVHASSRGIAENIITESWEPSADFSDALSFLVYLLVAMPPVAKMPHRTVNGFEAIVQSALVIEVD